jgi:hypothetical protein
MQLQHSQQELLTLQYIAVLLAGIDEYARSEVTRYVPQQQECLLFFIRTDWLHPSSHFFTKNRQHVQNEAPRRYDNTSTRYTTVHNTSGEQIGFARDIILSTWMST